MFNGILVVSIVVPLLLAAVVAISPCLPPFLSSLFCRPDNMEWIFDKKIKLGFAIIEFVLYSMGTIAGAYYGVFFQPPAISRLWLDCKTLIESPDIVENQFSVYRKIQIYEKTLNSSIRDRIFLLMALLCPLFQVLAGFASIVAANSGNFSILVVCGMLYCVVLSVTLISFSAAAKVSQITQIWIMSTRAKCKIKVDRKTLKSLVSLRIQFGMNFVEALTPLVVQEFCVQQTTSLLLLR